MGNWTREGVFLCKNGVPRFGTGMYYVDHFCANGNANELARIAAMEIMAAAGIDWVCTPISDGDNDDTLAAAISLGIGIIPENNGYATIPDMVADNVGAFDMTLIADDISGLPATIETLCTNVKAADADTLCYASGDFLTVADYYLTGLECIGCQGYPIPAEPIIVLDTTYWNAMNNWIAKDGNYGVFVANAQLYKDPGAARGPSRAEVLSMTKRAIAAHAGAIIWYAYFDVNNDFGVSNPANAWEGILDSLEYIRTNEDALMIALNELNA